MAHTRVKASRVHNARFAPAVLGTAFRTVASGFWQTLAKALFNGYRPELHYMRGPGPRWIEKHGTVALLPDRPSKEAS
jgi:hypothetical protein